MKLRNHAGVVVSVSDGTAARLGSEWVPAEADAPPAPTKPTPARRTRTK